VRGVVEGCFPSEFSPRGDNAEGVVGAHLGGGFGDDFGGGGGGGNVAKIDGDGGGEVGKITGGGGGGDTGKTNGGTATNEVEEEGPRNDDEGDDDVDDGGDGVTDPCRWCSVFLYFTSNCDLSSATRFAAAAKSTSFLLMTGPMSLFKRGSVLPGE